MALEVSDTPNNRYKITSVGQATPQTSISVSRAAPVPKVVSVVNAPTHNAPLQVSPAPVNLPKLSFPELDYNKIDLSVDSNTHAVNFSAPDWYIDTPEFQNDVKPILEQASTMPIDSPQFKSIVNGDALKGLREQASALKIRHDAINNYINSYSGSDRDNAMTFLQNVAASNASDKDTTTQVVLGYDKNNKPVTSSVAEVVNTLKGWNDQSKANFISNHDAIINDPNATQANKAAARGILAFAQNKGLLNAGAGTKALSAVAGVAAGLGKAFEWAPIVGSHLKEDVDSLNKSMIDITQLKGAGTYYGVGNLAGSLGAIATNIVLGNKIAGVAEAGALLGLSKFKTGVQLVGAAKDVIGVNKISGAIIKDIPNNLAFGALDTLSNPERGANGFVEDMVLNAAGLGAFKGAGPALKALDTSTNGALRGISTSAAAAAQRAFDAVSKVPGFKQVRNWGTVLRANAIEGQAGIKRALRTEFGQTKDEGKLVEGYNALQSATKNGGSIVAKMQISDAVAPAYTKVGIDATALAWGKQKKAFAQYAKARSLLAHDVNGKMGFSDSTKKELQKMVDEHADNELFNEAYNNLSEYSTKSADWFANSDDASNLFDKATLDEVRSAANIEDYTPLVAKTKARAVRPRTKPKEITPIQTTKGAKGKSVDEILDHYENPFTAVQAKNTQYASDMAQNRVSNLVSKLVDDGYIRGEEILSPELNKTIREGAQDLANEKHFFTGEDITRRGAKGRKITSKGASLFDEGGVGEKWIDDLATKLEDIDTLSGKAYDDLSSTITDMVDKLVNHIKGAPEFKNIIARLMDNGVKDEATAAAEIIKAYKKDFLKTLNDRLLKATRSGDEADLGARIFSSKIDDAATLARAKQAEVNAKATPIVKPSDPLAALKQEALKYKSADEFVKSQGTPVYHGTNANLKDFTELQAGAKRTGFEGTNSIFASENPELAGAYGKNLLEGINTGKVLDTTKLGNKLDPNERVIPKEFVDYKTNPILGPRDRRVLEESYFKSGTPSNITIDHLPNIQEYFRSKGYSAVQIPRGSDVKGPATEMVIIDPTNIRTKQQLTDLYNQAHAEAKVAKPSVKINSNLQQELDHFKQFNIKGDREKEIKDLKAQIGIFDDTDSVIVPYYRNGEQGFYRVDDPVVASYLISPHAPQVDSVVQNIATGITRAFKAGTTTFNPAFILTRNLPRDIGSGTTMASLGMIDGRTFVQQLVRRLGYTPEQAEALLKTSKAEVSNATFVASGRVEKSVNQLIAEGYTHLPNNVGNLGKRIWHGATREPLRALEVPGQKVEEFTRNRVFAVTYADTLQRTGSESLAMRQAVFMANEATANFLNTGLKASSIIRTVPYLQAAINGATSFVRLATIDPLGVGMRITAGYILPMTYIYSKNMANNSMAAGYFDIPEYIRSQNLVIMLDDKNYVTIALPQEILPFTNSLRVMMEAAHGRDGNIMGKLFDALSSNSPIDVSGFNDTGVEGGVNVGMGFSRALSGIMPQYFNVAYQVATGKNPYTGNPLGPDDASSPQEDTFEGKNSFLLGKLARITGMPQSKIQAVYSGLTGGLGQNILNIADKLAGAPEEQQGGKGLLDNIAQNLLGVPSSQANQDYWQGYNKLAAQKQRLSKEYDTLYYDIQNGDKESEDKWDAATQQFQQAISDFYTKYSDYYSRAGGFQPYQLKQLTNLLDFETQKTAKPGTVQAADIQQANYDAQDEAKQQAFDMGLPITNTQDLYGRVLKDTNGKVSFDYSNTTSIPSILKSQYYGVPRQIATEFDQAVSANKKAGTKSLNSEMQSYYDKLDKLYDRAKGLHGDAATAIYNQISAVQEKYMTDVFDPRIKPLIDKYGAAVLTNSKVLDELQNLIMVPSDFTPFASKKRQPYRKDDTRAYLLDRYGVGSLNKENFPTDKEADQLIQKINSEINAGRPAAAKDQYNSLLNKIRNNQTYVDPDQLQRIAAYVGAMNKY